MGPYHSKLHTNTIAPQSDYSESMMEIFNKLSVIVVPDGPYCHMTAQTFIQNSPVSGTNCESKTRIQK